MSYFYYRYNVLTYNNNNINNRFKHSYIINRTLEIWRIKEEGRNKKKQNENRNKTKLSTLKTLILKFTTLSLFFSLIYPIRNNKIIITK